MKSISRRKLADYAVDEMLSGRSSQAIAGQLAAELINSRRKAEYQLLIKDIYHTIESRGITAIVSVQTARRLDGSTKKLIEQFTAKLAKTEYVDLSERTDPSLIAGLKFQTARLSWDGSAKSRLDKLALRSSND